MKKFFETSFYNRHREWLKKYGDCDDKELVICRTRLAQNEDVCNCVLFFVSYLLPLLVFVLVVKVLAS